MAPKMKKLILFGFGLLVAIQVAMAQGPVGLGDRQEILFKGQILRRVGGDTYSPVLGLPEVNSVSAVSGQTQTAWDGSSVYLVGRSESGDYFVKVGSPFMAAGGDRRWFWTEPKDLHLGKDPATLLGAWGDNLLFLQARLDANGKARMAKGEKVISAGYTLVRVDLGMGKTISIHELSGAQHWRATCLFENGAFHVFTAAGAAVKVEIASEPWVVQTLSPSFWAEAGITLCKDTGEYQNPWVFGRAFFDSDGTMLIPAQVYLPLDRSDIDRAWSKLPQNRKADLIRTGNWPVPTDKEIGWKDEVFFLRFDPTTRKFSTVEPSMFAHLVEERDMNFITHRFRDIDPNRVYTTYQGKFLLMEEALAMESLKKATKVDKSVPDNKPKREALPTSKPEDAGEIPVKGIPGAESSK